VKHSSILSLFIFSSLSFLFYITSSKCICIKPKMFFVFFLRRFGSFCVLSGLFIYSFIFIMYIFLKLKINFLLPLNKSSNSVHLSIYLIKNSYFFSPTYCLQSNFTPRNQRVKCYFYPPGF
jgi:hypothetical protein